MGLNRVNEDIRTTLHASESPDFWWLNNGVTILATDATVTGKSIQIEGVQIVNGLQTSEAIARFFADGKDDAEERAVLVKVIKSTNASVRDAIIRATNNQTPVELTSLHATDKVQRDIEDVLLRDGLYYERRTNFYVNQGHAASQIITPLYIASGFATLVLRTPSSGTILKAKFMRSDESYGRVFSQEVPIKVWPRIARILKKTDGVLETLRPLGTGGNERFLKNWRQITAFLSVARVFGKFTFSAAELADINIDALTDEVVTTSWKFVELFIGNRTNVKRRLGKHDVIQVCRKAAVSFSLVGVEAIEQTSLGYKPNKAPRFTDEAQNRPVSPEFIAQVHRTLPEQPWKPGVHRETAAALSCDSRRVSEAIQQLVADGRRYLQKDGVVYGPDGNVIAVDPERSVTNLDT